MTTRRTLSAVCQMPVHRPSWRAPSNDRSMNITKRWAGTVQEIERKFIVTPSVFHTCQQLATSAREIHMMDTYYDYPDFRLTQQDMWLRERNQSWELKVPAKAARITATDTLQVDHYDEITHLPDITTVACPNTKGTEPKDGRIIGDEQFPSILAANGISPFARLLTKRCRFRIELANTGSTGKTTINVDIDTVTCDPSLILSQEQKENASHWRYEVGEVELLAVNGNASIENASSVMEVVLATLGIHPKSVNGKVLQYLQQFSVQHYAALDKSGLLKAKGLKQ